MRPAQFSQTSKNVLKTAPVASPPQHDRNVYGEGNLQTHSVRGAGIDFRRLAGRQTIVRLCTGLTAAALILSTFSSNSMPVYSPKTALLTAERPTPAFEIAVAVVPETIDAIAEPVRARTIPVETGFPRVQLARATNGAEEITVARPLPPNHRREPNIHTATYFQTVTADAIPQAQPIPAQAAPTIKELTDREQPVAASPAKRLHLSGAARAKQAACLAKAIYFESRGETLRGQIGVAQVILNRVFIRFYPDTICDVVYQNARRRHACQFSFACDGKREKIQDQYAWSVANYVAALALDGRVWDREIGKATHYHAFWVNPSWVNEMHKLATHGVHTFYRPVRWGDGADEPTWSRHIAHIARTAFN